VPVFARREDLSKPPYNSIPTYPDGWNGQCMNGSQQYDYQQYQNNTGPMSPANGCYGPTHGNASFKLHLASILEAVKGMAKANRHIMGVILSIQRRDFQGIKMVTTTRIISQHGIAAHLNSSKVLMYERMDTGEKLIGDSTRVTDVDLMLASKAAKPSILLIPIGIMRH